MNTFILGGARSGKSQFAEQLATQSSKQVVYIATAQALDSEMAERIARHRANRPSDWITIEEPLALAEILSRHTSDKRLLLVDCLTLWLSNLLDDKTPKTQYLEQRTALIDTLPILASDIILVSNEVGTGITPINPLSRRFVDAAGLLHQEIARICDQFAYVTAGFPHWLKQVNADL